MCLCLLLQKLDSNRAPICYLLLILAVFMRILRGLRLLESELVLEELEHLVLHLRGQICGLPVPACDGCKKLIESRLLLELLQLHSRLLRLGLLGGNRSGLLTGLSYSGAHRLWHLAELFDSLMLLLLLLLLVLL